MNKEIAILMAAGKGERMRPITLMTPKPLVKVNGTPMIETVLTGLLSRGVSEIYVVVGYLKDHFRYLEEKYAEVKLIENKEYQVKNNISSIYAALPYLGENNCFICESDLYVSDISIFNNTFEKSCYYGKLVPGYSDDWVFIQEKDRIVKIKRGGTDVYNMTGIAYFRAEDAKMIAAAIREAYNDDNNGQLYWDEIVDTLTDQIELVITPIETDQIVEIDSVTELCVIDPSYKGGVL